MTSFAIRPAMADDVPSAVAVLGDAFQTDALMAYFFTGGPGGPRSSSMAFFSILLRARLALRMPALVLEQDERVLGVAMGYDTRHPEWPARFNDEWEALESAVPGLAGRFAAYDRIADAHRPHEPHHYLGVLGVHSSIRGQGDGKALLTTFCNVSAADPQSQGVYLETVTPSSLEFYLRNGVEVRGEAALGGNTLWCVYRSNR